MLICIQYCPCFCILELTLHGAVSSNAAKLLDRCSRGNFECKYILFLVQISVQINRLGTKLGGGWPKSREMTSVLHSKIGCNFMIYLEIKNLRQRTLSEMRLSGGACSLLRTRLRRNSLFNRENTGNIYWYGIDFGSPFATNHTAARSCPEQSNLVNLRSGNIQGIALIMIWVHGCCC